MTEADQDDETRLEELFGVLLDLPIEERVAELRERLEESHQLLRKTSDELESISLKRLTEGGDDEASGCAVSDFVTDEDLEELLDAKKVMENLEKFGAKATTKKLETSPEIESFLRTMDVLEKGMNRITEHFGEIEEVSEGLHTCVRQTEKKLVKLQKDVLEADVDPEQLLRIIHEENERINAERAREAEAAAAEADKAEAETSVVVDTENAE